MPIASTASVAVASESLFQTVVLVKVASVSTKLEVSVRPFKSTSGTPNSMTSFVAEMTTWEPAMPYQVPESNHSTTATPRVLTCRAS